MGCCDRRFRALMRRNWIYRKRHWVSSLFQLLLPVASIGILVAIKYAVKDTDGFKRKTVEPIIRSDSDVMKMYSFKDYVDSVMEVRQCVPNVDLGRGSRRTRNLKFSISGMQRNSWPVPFLKCDARSCNRVGENANRTCEVSSLVLAVDDGNDSTAKSRVDSFATYIETKYPSAFTALVDMGSDHSLVRSRHPDGGYWTSDKIQKYVTSDDYGKTGFPKIAVAVVMEKGSSSGASADEYAYQIRVNSTNFNVLENQARPVSITTPSTKRIFDNFAKKPEDVCKSQGGAPDMGSREDECTAQYVYNGALPIQRLVDDWIIAENKGNTNTFVAENGVSFVNFPTRRFVEDGFYKQIEAFAPLLFVLGLIYPMASSVRSIVQEKEFRQKELLKMMSITEFTIGWSWFVSLWLFYFVIAIFCTIITKQLYENSSGIPIFLFWIISLTAVLMYAKVMAAINNKSSRATLISILIFFCGYFLIQAVKYDEGSSGAIQGLSLHPVAAISYGLQMIGSLEDKGVGLTRDTLRTTDNPSGYTMGNCFTSLIVDILLWGFLSGYLNRVLKGEYGQSLPWNYCFTKSYWCGGSSADTNNNNNFQEETPAETVNNDMIPIEPVSDVLKAQEEEGTCVAIRNLSKQFDTKTAVDGLNLTMYNGQITALLGHNGAGKTTTINMLTGMVTPTSGYAVVNGHNIVSQMSKVRKNVGICLQHDCLFPMLTVKEHVEFFAAVKGVYEENVTEDAEQHILTAIEDVALSEKINTYSKDLSGGMKRKLSVAIAFCGDSNVVFLDEPTSGMDPYSRRFTWNVIRQYRENRCIVLTTHFMDEADLLGDRIAIMAEGQLRCCGSSLFLKKHYGVGYQLTIEKLPNAEDSKQIEEELQSVVKSNVAESSLLSNVGTEISFQLPIGASKDFLGIFEQLDSRIEKQEIVTYGVSITTLDEVFLMVARGKTAGVTERHRSTIVNTGEPVSSVPATNYEESAKSYRSQDADGTTSLFASHVQSLIKKRAMNFKRDRKAWCCSAILPIVLVFIGFLIVTLAIPSRNLKKLELSLDPYNSKLTGSSTRNPILYNNPGVFSCHPGNCLYQGGLNDGTRNDYCGEIARIPNSVETCSISLSDDIAAEFDGFGANGVGQDLSNISQSSKFLYENSELKKEQSMYGAIYLTHDMSSVTSSDGQAYSNVAKSACESRNGTNCDSYGGIGYVVSTNFTALHSSLLFQSLADEAIVRNASGKANFRIKPTIWPLPITKVEDNFAKAESSFSAWFLIVLSFPFITGAYATFVVTERMTKAKHLQTVAGVTPSAYWLSTYFWDVLNYQIPLWAIVVLMHALGVDAFTKSERDIPGGVILLLMAYGPAAAGFTYCVSFFFHSPSSANLFVVVFNFFVGLAGPLACFILRLIQATNNRSNPNTSQSLKGTAVIIESILRFIPSFSLAKGLFFTINIESFATIEERPDLSVWSSDILLVEFIFLIIEGLTYIWLAILIDRLSTKPRAVQRWKAFVSCLTCRCFCSSKKKEMVVRKDVPLDEDVAAETERIQSGEGNNDLIVINNLTKIYNNNKLAVDHMSLGIPSGECFGLLGINGAGKTTTMAMLTAEFPPTEGDATLNSYSVTTQPEKTRQQVGYCPQFDAHFQNMTGREHVELYAVIKGVPKEFVKDAAAAKLREVGLSEFDSDRLSSGYSGGMKRKLSVACATIGNPQIVFLDEPSTGMDPVARRDLWKVISNMVVNETTGEKQNTSIILTTHSMEECEALCPRIGIMAGGKLKCLGSAQRLKTRFGQGFQVEIKVHSPTEDCEDFKNVLQTIYAVFPPIPSSNENEEGVVSTEEDAVLNLEQTKEAATKVDPFLLSLIDESDAGGYLIIKSASSSGGITAKELTSFFVEELRVKKVKDYLEETYSNCVLRERQDTKVRYEVGSENLRIASLFSDIEDSKSELNVADYGISQTSLEQVFNMHAAEAELEKKGVVDN